MGGDYISGVTMEMNAGTNSFIASRWCWLRVLTLMLMASHIPSQIQTNTTSKYSFANNSFLIGVSRK